MQADIVTLCHSAVAYGNQISMLGAFNIVHAPSLPHKYPPFTAVARIRLDEAERRGKHRLRLTVLDTDGRTLGEAFVDFHMPEPPPDVPERPELFRPIAPLTIIFPITGMELRSYGEHAIDLALDGQPSLRTPFYVYHRKIFRPGLPVLWWQSYEKSIVPDRVRTGSLESFTVPQTPDSWSSVRHPLKNPKQRNSICKIERFYTFLIRNQPLRFRF